MPGYKKHSWHTIRARVQKLYPELYAIIEQLAPDDSYELYSATYPYGALILDQGVFQLMNKKGQLVPISDASIDQHVQNALGYTGTIPMGLVAKNSIETFFYGLDNRTIPSSFYAPGDMISLWRVLEGECSYQEGSLWSISAGSRAICMLPKLSDKSCYENLKRKFQLKQDVPKTLREHWTLFTTLANHPQFAQPWQTEIIYFSAKWLTHQQDPAWVHFYKFIIQKAWNDSTLKRNQFIFDFAFSLLQKKCNLKPNPYLADTVKHLIGIGTGGMPAFVPAQDEIAAPVSGLVMRHFIWSTPATSRLVHLG